MDEHFSEEADPITTSTVVAVEAAISAPALSSSSSSSSNAVACPAPSVVGADTDEGLHVSPLGYVTCSWPKFVGLDTPTLGLIGMKLNNEEMFANCHLHPKCSLGRSVQVKSRPRMHMAKWLAMGRPVPRSAPRAERLAAGAEHRALYRPPSEG